MKRIRRLLPAGWLPAPPVVAVVRLTGPIGVPAPFRRPLTLEVKSAALERAFAMEPAAVAIVINSPGGAAVQSHFLYARIRALAEEHHVEVYVFIEDVAASGGYMIALAGDVIIAHPISIVGSIGVISAGFGFTGLIEKLGIERRVHTAGAAKSMLDPFQPERDEDVRRLSAVQADAHRLFADLVKYRRGVKLQGTEDDLFSGAIWSGREALALGLVDEIGDLRATLRARFGEKVRVRNIDAPSAWRWPWPFGAREGSQSRAGPDLPGASVLAALEERLFWQRYGL